MINTLSVVNEMLGTLGELPVNDLDAFHPVIPKAIAKLGTINSTIQAERWWFNTEYPTLTPQAGSGEIMLPTDLLSVDSIAQWPAVAVRGNRLYNLDDSTYVFTRPLPMRLHREIPFDELPMLARAYIGVAAVLSFQTDIDGDPIKMDKLEQRVAQTRALCNAEHSRNVRANMLQRPGVLAALNRMRGHRVYPSRR